MLQQSFNNRIIYETKIGCIGLGKLGMPCAEAMATKGFDVAGYDIVTKSSYLVEIRQSIEDLCRDRDIVFVATPTPHEDGYDGSLMMIDEASRSKICKKHKKPIAQIGPGSPR